MSQENVRKKMSTWFGLSFKLSGEKHNALTSVFLIFLLGISVTVLMTLYINRLPKILEIGSPAATDYQADRNYEIIDEEATGKVRDEASENVLSVYDFDPTIQTGVIQKIKNSFNQSRSFLEENSLPLIAKKTLSEKMESQLKNEFQTSMGVEVPDDLYEVLRKSAFNPSLEQVLLYLTKSVLDYPIIHNKEELTPLLEKGFVLRKLSSEGSFPEDVVHGGTAIQDLTGAYHKINEVKLQSLEKDFHLEFLDNDSFKAIKEVTKSLIKTNMNYNGLETDIRRQKARSNIKPITVVVKRGESIIRSGELLTKRDLTILEGIRGQRQKTSRVLKFFGTFIFVNLILFIVYFFASRYIKKFNPDKKDLVFLGLTLIIFMAILRIGVFFSGGVRDAFQDSFLFNLQNDTLYYLIPIAGGAMLVRFILNSETSLVFAVVTSLFAGVFLENNLELTSYYLISGVFAAHAVAHVDKRSTLLLSGLYVGFISMLAIFSLKLLSVASSADELNPSNLFPNLITAFLSGITTAVMVLVLSPVMEALFNYTTDIKLLELANLSHPLLKEMIVRAPGTYHHSQMVGVLAEAGAQAIGANPLLARVGSYYHDIGKIKKPQYFIENQSGGVNPHDKLAPSMSALIIEAHVKDGIELAEEHKLPSRIMEMIPQHQGTKIIGYFYDKAKKTSDPSLDKVDEKDYRYLGPKPQTREAGIIMLADTLEAAVRSLPEKSPNKIQATVEKLVNQHFVDEQLDECDLTLKDLHRIAGAFTKILIGIYHQRVEYPEGALVSPETNNATLSQQRVSGESNIAHLFRKKN